MRLHPLRPFVLQLWNETLLSFPPWPAAAVLPATRAAEHGRPAESSAEDVGRMPLGRVREFSLAPSKHPPAVIFRSSHVVPQIERVKIAAHINIPVGT